MRLWPRSLLGQTLMAVAVALLLAQVVTSWLLLRVAEDRREDALLTAAEVTLWGAPRFRRDRGEEEVRIDRREELPRELRRPGRMLRGEVTSRYPLLPGETNKTGWAERLSERMTPLVAKPHDVIVTIRDEADDPVIARRVRDRPRTEPRRGPDNGKILIAAIQWEAGGSWHVARLPYSRGDRLVLFVTAAQTLSIFVVLMVLLFFLLRRITRPLAQLTERTERFAQYQVAEEPLTERGPADTRRLIVAHNAMEARVAALLDEKDVMLGAIGHDLKTPLAALRVRIESVPDDIQREKMAASIEDITATLDDILALARVGRRSDLEAERVDVRALVTSVAEEFEDLGEDIMVSERAAGEPRMVARVQVTWLKRALRNLVSNALRYGETARVSMFAEGDIVVLRVDDTGPGIPEDRIADMLEPFTRGETSRNRATGGAGLGLTLARAIAEQHGGTLLLTNRSEGGLRAEIRIPARIA